MILAAFQEDSIAQRLLYETEMYLQEEAYIQARIWWLHEGDCTSGLLWGMREKRAEDRVSNVKNKDGNIVMDKSDIGMAFTEHLSSISGTSPPVTCCKIPLTGLLRKS